MTSKQRAYLKGLAMTMEPILQVGKSSITPEHTAAVPALFEENVWKRQTEKLALWEAHSIPFISVI